MAVSTTLTNLPLELLQRIGSYLPPLPELIRLRSSSRLLRNLIQLKDSSYVAETVHLLLIPTGRYSLAFETALSSSYLSDAVKVEILSELLSTIWVRALESVYASQFRANTPVHVNVVGSKVLVSGTPFAVVSCGVDLFTRGPLASHNRPKLAQLLLASKLYPTEIVKFAIDYTLRLPVDVFAHDMEFAYMDSPDLMNEIMRWKEQNPVNYLQKLRFENSVASETDCQTSVVGSPNQSDLARWMWELCSKAARQLESDPEIRIVGLSHRPLINRRDRLIKTVATCNHIELVEWIASAYREHIATVEDDTSDFEDDIYQPPNFDMDDIGGQTEGLPLLSEACYLALKLRLVLADAFVHAAERGHVEMIQTLYRHAQITFGLPASRLEAMMLRALEHGLMAGDLESSKWLYGKLGSLGNDKARLGKLLRLAVNSGNLGVVKFLYEEGCAELTLECARECIRCGVQGGYVDILRWFTTSTPVRIGRAMHADSSCLIEDRSSPSSTTDPYESISLIFLGSVKAALSFVVIRTAFQSGYLGVCKWLHELGGFATDGTGYTMRENENDPKTSLLVRAAQNMQMDVVEWIYEVLIPNLSIGRAQIQEEVEESLSAAAKCGHSEMVHWLLRHVDVSGMSDVRKASALKYASKSGHIDLVTTLDDALFRNRALYVADESVKESSSTPTNTNLDVNRMITYTDALVAAASSGHVHILRYFIDVYGMKLKNVRSLGMQLASSANLPTRTRYFVSLFSRAAQSGHLDVLVFLDRHGAFGWTHGPITQGARSDDQIDSSSSSILISSHFDQDEKVQTIVGSGLLKDAVESKRFDVVEFLVRIYQRQVDADLAQMASTDNHVDGGIPQERSQVDLSDPFWEDLKAAIARAAGLALLPVVRYLTNWISTLLSSKHIPNIRPPSIGVFPCFSCQSVDLQLAISSAWRLPKASCLFFELARWIVCDRHRRGSGGRGRSDPGPGCGLKIPEHTKIIALRMAVRNGRSGGMFLPWFLDGVPGVKQILREKFDEVFLVADECGNWRVVQFLRAWRKELER
ncbi:hypothetical protein BJ742DRAFT_851779 [Cladochytrium replicatum]|nr:hypothetical protein BJ742DRAFT_851779 [Cladochytrium replicatum]